MLTTKPKLFCLLAFLLLTAPLQAQVSLDSILGVVEANNPMLKMYEQRSNAMRSYAQGARSWMPPMVGGGLWMTPYPGQRMMEDRDRGMAMVTIEQEIPNPAKLRANQAYMDSRAAVEEAGRAKSYNQLRAEAKTQYYQWLVLEKRIAVLRESEQIMEMMLRLARIRYPYGQAQLSSIYKAEGRLYEVQNMLVMTQAEIEQKNIMLNTLMNLPRENRFRIDTTVREFIQPPVIADTAQLTANRSDIRQINQTIRSMELNTQLERVQLRPDFRLRFDHMQPFGTMMPAQFTLMGMVSIPIAPWSARMYRANVQGMNAEIRAMEWERQSILNEAQGMLSGMGAEIRSKQVQLDNYRNKILPALQRNYNAVMLAYEENNAQLPAVVDAWETLNMARMQYLDNLQDWYLMIVTYEKELER